jgi:hypothetical protein
LKRRHAGIVLRREIDDALQDVIHTGHDCVGRHERVPWRIGEAYSPRKLIESLEVGQICRRELRA